MRLVITTPAAVFVARDDVRHVRAEDRTGAFGIAAGHAEFITTLEVSVLTFTDVAGGEHHVAVRGGILSVRRDTVEVATRQAVGEDTLEHLGRAVLERFRKEAREEEQEWISTARLHVAMVRQLRRYLDTGHSTSLTRGAVYVSALEEKVE